MERKRPFGVTLLAILAAIGALIAIFHTLQMLHLLPIRGPFGNFGFFTFNFLGAILWGILALIYIWVVRMLWNLNPQGWLFVAVIATLNLILAVVSILGQSSWQAVLPAIVVNGLILIYCLLPGTKEAFGMSSEPGSASAMAGGSPASDQVVETRTVAVEEDMAAPEVEPMVDEEQDSLAPEMAALAGAAKGFSSDGGPEAAAEAEEVSAATEMAAAAAVEKVSVEQEPEMEVEAEEVSAATEMAAVEMIEEDDGDAVDKRKITGAASLTRDLAYVEGIGQVYSDKLNDVGVGTPQELLERGATPQGRKELADATGISEQLILKWVGQVDMYRIKGLGSEYSELLKAAGVDTVPELAQRNPKNLHAKLREVNDAFKRVRHLPSQSQVADWVKQAKELPRMVSY